MQIMLTYGWTKKRKLMAKSEKHLRNRYRTTSKR